MGDTDKILVIIEPDVHPKEVVASAMEAGCLHKSVPIPIGHSLEGLHKSGFMVPAHGSRKRGLYQATDQREGDGTVPAFWGEGPAPPSASINAIP